MKNRILIFCFILITGFTFAQLNTIQLNVSGTNETCLGNGTIQIATTNVTVGAQVALLTFKLPELNIPISNSANLSSLSAGTYRIVATQSLGNLSNVQQQDFVIQNQIVALTFGISNSSAQSCGNTAAIVINILTGTANNYQIIQGPQIVPLQTSNTFSGLVAGKYRIRVFDICGQAFVKDYTLVVQNPTLTISAVSVPSIPTSCLTINVSNTISPSAGAVLTYPLIIKYTIHPPNGAPDIVLTQTEIAGPNAALVLSKTIDLYQNSIFNYDIEVTDFCGRIFSKNNNEIDPNPIATLSDRPNKCGEKYLNIAVSNFLGPYTVAFLESPTGFNAANFNTLNLGPFDSNSIFYGSDSAIVPFGNYKIKITDACGRSSIAEKNVLLSVIKPTVSAVNNGCGSLFGYVSISIPNSRAIVSATITSAPSAYTNILPFNVTSLISSNGILNIMNLPLGFYDITLKDECGQDHILLNVEVPNFVLQSLVEEQTVNCTPGSGAIKLTSGNGPLASIKIVAAPSNFNETLPYNASNMISNGALYITDLPAGNYTFEGVDACGYTVNKTIAITGYSNAANLFSIERNCGSFNLTINDSSNGISGQSYWLQKKNPTTNVWEHPNTGVVYTEGAIPNATNSLVLSNNVILLNLTMKGDFRILKTFVTYNNGNQANIFKTCLEEYGSFEFFDLLKINNAYSLNCSGGSGVSSVLLDVIGVAPYTFRIKSRNGDTSFTVNNGISNIFNGLLPATYNFEVEDDCGSIQNRDFTVGALANLVNANQPNGLLICQDDSTQFDSFDLTQQKTQILGDQNNDDYLISYYTTLANAVAGSNPILNPNFYINTSNPQTIFVRVIHRTITGCFATTSFEINSGKKPILVIPDTFTLCDTIPLELTANDGFNSYEWSTGALTQTINVNKPGAYTIEVKNFYGTLICSDQKTITVNQSGKAKLISIETQDWSDTNNALNVKVTGFGDYIYSLDNINFQTTGLFNNLLSGTYKVYIKDKNGCGTLIVETYFINYPKFFTPNADGFNDFWQIENSAQEPKNIISIFDRFGKLLKVLDPKSKGWDGTFQGNALPSSDYWFVLERIDGRIYKGHFTLKR